MAGAAQVVATHWTVGDLEAALLGGELFRCWDGGSVAAALARAQHRFRAEISGADVARTLRGWFDLAPGDAALRAALAHWEKRADDSAAFADTTDWAAFHLVGLPG